MKNKIDKVIDKINKLVALHGIRTNDIPEIVLWELVKSFDVEYGAYYEANIFKGEYECRIAVDISGNTNKKGYVWKKDLSSDSDTENLQKNGLIRADKYNRHRYIWKTINLSNENFLSDIITGDYIQKEEIISN